MKVDNLVINNTIKSFEGMNEMTADVKQALFCLLLITNSHPARFQ